MKKLRCFAGMFLLVLALCACENWIPDNDMTNGLPTGATVDPTTGTTEPPTSNATEHIHLFGEWEVVAEPTCTNIGVKQRTCPCGETETEEISATGHLEMTDEAIAATCTTPGLTAGKHCAVCGEILIRQENTPAKGHTYRITTTAPTCTKAGDITYTCPCGYCRSTPKKLTISILGDSISTMVNYSNGTAANMANSTIKNGVAYYPAGDVESVADTWWYKAAEMLGGEILVNNSWSSSCLLNPRLGSVGAYVDRCVQLHDNTGENAGEEPDIIAVFLGTNDWNAYPSTLGTFADIDFENLIIKCEVEEKVTYAEPTTSMEAYAIVLDKISRRYPNAQVYCFTLLPHSQEEDQPTDFNADIKKLAEYFKAHIVDLWSSGFCSNPEIFDGLMYNRLHPNAAGMTEIANAFVAAVQENLHTAEIDEAVPPTCTETGLTVGTHCADCNKVLEKQKIVSATGHDHQNGICARCGHFAADVDGDGVLEILAIGNSFSEDTLEYVYQIARDLEFEKVVIGNLCIGGCSLQTHATNAKEDKAAYIYYYNDNGTWVATENYKISTALESRSWDFVSLQQSSGFSGMEDTYNEDLDTLIAYVQSICDAKLIWNMTWAYQQDSDHPDFSKYDSNQEIMYQAIVSAVQNKIAANGKMDCIVPCATAVQNSRTSALGDTLTRDGYHLSDYGCYLAGLMFIKTVTGLPLDSLQYRPDSISEYAQKVALEAVENAQKQPFAVTASQYTDEKTSD